MWASRRYPHLTKYLGPEVAQLVILVHNSNVALPVTGKAKDRTLDVMW
jgi:hypothetical protein